MLKGSSLCNTGLMGEMGNDGIKGDNGTLPETVASCSLMGISIIQHSSSPKKNLFPLFGSDYQVLNANETITCLCLQRATIAARSSKTSLIWSFSHCLEHEDDRINIPDRMFFRRVEQVHAS